MTDIVRLKVVSGPKNGTIIEFRDHDTFIVGRMNDCHISIPNDGYLSRHHFLIEVNPPDICIRDLGSLNGTFVNGKKIGGRQNGESVEQGAARNYLQVDLKNGDEIRTGDTCFIVEKPFLHNLNLIRCQRCGKDISLEIISDRDGDYICKQCVEEIVLDPKEILKVILNDEQSLNPDSQIPNYEVIKPIGKGGMGEVFLVRHKVTGEKAALKTMLSKIAVSLEAKENFMREIRTCTELHHPNIVRFIESGASGNLFYIIMEYCDYGNLLDYMEDLRRPLSVKEAMPFMLHILDGLSYAHSKGFVHRDLKPQNILLSRSRDGLIAKVGDFGLSKNFAKAGLSGMTITGNYSGSFPFMPREQVTNYKYVKPVTDLWSFSATFYFILSGNLPRDVKNGEDPMLAILKGNVIPLRNRRAEIPVSVAKIIDKALLNDPNQRYQTAEEMKRALLMLK